MTTHIERDRIDVSGVVSLDSVSAELLDASGSLTVHGDARADTTDLSGSSHFHGDLSTDVLESSGSLVIDGDVRADGLATSGSARMGGNVATEDAECSGSVRVDGDLTADEFVGAGSLEFAVLVADAVRIRGAVEAERIEANDVSLDLVSESKVGRIEADSVAVTRTEPDGFLEAERIEGDDVALDHVAVKTVVGDHVRLGANASVETVRADELDAADGATVGSVE